MSTGRCDENYFLGTLLVDRFVIQVKTLTTAKQEEMESRHKAEEMAHDFAMKLDEAEKQRQEVEADLLGKLKVGSSFLFFVSVSNLNYV